MSARVPTTIVLALLAVMALAATACGGGDAGQPKASAAVTRCPAAAVAGWKQVSRRAGIPVYCPVWLPSPLQPAIDMGGTPGADNATVAFSRDRSYLVSWIWAGGTIIILGVLLGNAGVRRAVIEPVAARVPSPVGAS